MDLDPDRYSESDRRAVDPPITVDMATWAHAGQLDWWVKERQDGTGGYVVPTAVNGGSELPICVS
jgi:hypothetical protein